jgi:hypothetical protein
MKSLKLQISSCNKISKTIRNITIKKFGSKDKKHGILGWLTESARNTSVYLSDAIEKLGIKRTPPHVDNPYENYGKTYKSPGTTESDNSKSFAENPQKEVEENLKRGEEGMNKNQPTQHGQHSTYGSAGLGTSELPYGSHTVTDYKISEKQKEQSEDDINRFKFSENNFGTSEAGKKSFSYQGEGFSVGIGESGRMDVIENSNINSVSAGAMGSSDSNENSGSIGTQRKYRASSSEYGISGLGSTSGSSGIAAGAGTSGTMHGAKDTGPATSQYSAGIGSTSGSTVGEGFAHGNKTYNSSQDQSDIEGAYNKVESLRDKKKEDNNR